MNCECFRGRLYLYRNGELSNREAEELVQHLHSCESCRLEKERIDRTEAAISRIRSIEPKIQNPEALLSQIVSRVRTTIPEATSLTFFDRLLDLFIKPPIRFAAATFVVIATVTFLFQYVSLFVDIHNLEMSASQQIHNSPAMGAAYVVSSTQLAELAKSKELQAFIPPGDVGVTDGEIRVRRSDVAAFLSSNGFRSVTATLASSLLHMDRRDVERMITDIKDKTRILSGTEH